MKSPWYWTYLAFEADDEGNFVPAPVSRCECPAGFLFCSHMLGVLCILYLIQKDENLDIAGLKEMMPPPVKSIHSYPMPWQHAFGPNAIDLAVGRSLAEVLADSNDAGGGEDEEGIVGGENGGAEGGGDGGELEDDDRDFDFLGDFDDGDAGASEESDLPQDASSPPQQQQEEEEEKEEETRTPMNAPIEPGNPLNSPPAVADDEESDSDDSDYEVNEDEDDSDHELEDVEMEAMASEDFAAAGVDILGKVDLFVAKAQERAREEGGAKQYSHKLNLDNITKAQEEVLDDLNGPNENIECKLEQLKMHERLHQLYVGGRLKRKTLLSHYLHCTADARQRWIEQIEAVLEQLDADQREVKVVFLPTRLGKIPAGWYILADRGFSSCAPSYPHLNGQLTPFFLDGRDQFEAYEISVDRIKCKLRYGSETKFSQVTDCTALKDRIPRTYFRHLHEICDFAHGISNLCEPFYLPYDPDDDYFAAVREGRDESKKKEIKRLEERKRKLKAADEAAHADGASQDDDAMEVDVEDNTSGE